MISHYSIKYSLLIILQPVAFMCLEFRDIECRDTNVTNKLMRVSSCSHSLRAAASYLPEMAAVPETSHMHLFPWEGNSLVRSKPGSLRDALGCTDAITQAWHSAGTQAHLSWQLPQSTGHIRRCGACTAACADKTAQWVEWSMHWAFTIPIVSTHITAWGEENNLYYMTREGLQSFDN